MGSSAKPDNRTHQRRLCASFMKTGTVVDKGFFAFFSSEKSNLLLKSL